MRIVDCGFEDWDGSAGASPGFGFPSCWGNQSTGFQHSAANDNVKDQKFTKTLLFPYRLRVFLNPSPAHPHSLDIPKGMHKANNRPTTPVIQRFFVSTFFRFHSGWQR
jgi:hypothetical protein